MVWFLTLHISSLLFWCAALLYLPALMVGLAGHHDNVIESPRAQDSTPRFIFTHLATPAALVAIISGTGVFVFAGLTSVWLIVKLTLVSCLVIGHTLIGLLVLRLEDKSDRPMRGWCFLLAGLFCVLMTSILWVVLAKPLPETLA